ncbi:MAG TPA: sulfite exporter TauE/SafE family protein, partial [Candidatus Latescibacteria bacterium]|nr:sulfite exporter TauE/SafE family protein [Candidatus Latescibacterota bacterium]
MIGQHVWLWLVPMGFVLGALGTLIGAGGGFVLVPVLLLMYPRNSPETITSISLAVVFFNALSGSVAYGKMGRIDFRSGALFAAATIPGAILGAFTTDVIPRRTFNGVFGVLMVAAAAYLILQRDKGPGHVGSGDAHKTVRRIVEKDGTVHTYSFSLRAGMLW